MNSLAPRSLGLFLFGTALGACALVVACSSSDSGGGGDDAGSSGSSGFAESGTSGTSGISGSSGTSGGDGSTNDGAVAEKACDPAKADCKTGEVCTDIGRASPVCRPGCTSDATCTGTPKSGCVILSAGTPPGACVPTCKPYGTDCAAGFTCSRVPEQASVMQTSPLPFCKPTGATALLASCVNDPASCGANADCVFFPDVGEGVNDSKCHTLCDPTHDCGAGKGFCFTKTGDSFGFCHDG